MALEGSLKEFGLADILQLLYFQRKTGVLTVQSRLDRVKLLFNEGNVVGAESKKRDTASRLGRVLQKRGLLSADDLHDVVEEQKKTGARLGAILINKGLVSPEDIKEVLEFQLAETVMQLFSWKEGRYEFLPQAVPLDRDLPVSLDTQHFLMEGLRMLDEWSVMSGKISLDSLFGRTSEAGDELLSPEEREVIRHLDGKTDVTAIADLTGLESFQVSKILLGLAERGLIRKEELKEEAPALRAAPARRLWGLLPPLLLAAALAISVLAWLPLGLGLDRFRALQEISGLRFSIEAYREAQGRYPASVDRKDPWGNPYIYEDREDGFRLLSPGPDGRPGTSDDVY
ncbi:MAG: hypothetical protein Kow0025_23560 [Thermodesulfovibrionales bacterium]